MKRCARAIAIVASGDPGWDHLWDDAEIAAELLAARKATAASACTLDRATGGNHLLTKAQRDHGFRSDSATSSPTLRSVVYEKEENAVRPVMVNRSIAAV